jgi:hypothetical protein
MLAVGRGLLAALLAEATRAHPYRLCGQPPECRLRGEALLPPVTISSHAGMAAKMNEDRRRWLFVFVACIALTVVLDAIFGRVGVRSLLFGAFIGAILAMGDAAPTSWRNRRQRR